MARPSLLDKGKLPRAGKMTTIRWVKMSLPAVSHAARQPGRLIPAGSGPLAGSVAAPPRAAEDVQQGDRGTSLDSVHPSR